VRVKQAGKQGTRVIFSVLPDPLVSWESDELAQWNKYMQVFAVQVYT